MPGRSAEVIPWSIVYSVLLDDTVEPGRKAHTAWTIARDAGRSTRSKAMFERYMAAAWVARQYHGSGRLDLRRIDPSAWHQLETEARSDLEGEAGESRRLNLTYDALMERITPRMVEKAVAGWHTVQEQPAAPVAAAAHTAPRSLAQRSMAPALLALGVGLAVWLLSSWPQPPGPAPATSPAPSAAASAPQITGFSPNPVHGSLDPQRLTLIGAGFQPGATVVLRNDRTGSQHVILPDSPEERGFIRESEIELAVRLDEPSSTWTAEVINPDLQASGRYSFEVIGLGPPPPLLVDGVVSLTPAKINPGRPVAVTAEILRPEFVQAEALKLQLNIYRPPAGAISRQHLVTGDGVSFLFERVDVSGPRGMMDQAVFRPLRFAADGKTYISFVLNLPEDPGDVDYILNAGPEEDTNEYQALLPIGPIPAEPRPAELPPGD